MQNRCKILIHRKLEIRWCYTAAQSTDNCVSRRLSANESEQESRAVARKPRDAAAVLFGLKFADDIHYKFKSRQASSFKHTGTKQNLTQNGGSRSFKVTCFGVSGKAIRL